MMSMKIKIKMHLNNQNHKQWNRKIEEKKIK